MTDKGRRTPELPANIEEFIKAAGLIFAQLYAAFPETSTKPPSPKRSESMIPVGRPVGAVRLTGVL